ncbi:hypothetical protein JWJ88_13660 [Paracoccus methylovorus]|uniref:Phage tail protein n=1 Tax=Paracoccus methylovorus TaxID=2812658 RepID=A0ABX7JMB6_9RHOB|nr:hypothetical protein [Paracoccus methylovorus]QRZ15397.1 hypothetical protein JWJ88_13660 [Paracoccus methylovorus]
MLYPTAGARLYIADAPARGAGGVLPVAGWVEIGETEALGLLGVQWGVASTDLATEEYDGPDGYLVEYSVKTALRQSPMQIVLGNDPSDPGQVLLWTAARSTNHYPFRLVLPDGVSSRAWFGLVTALVEVFDSANSVMKLQADVLPATPIIRNDGA